MNNSDIYEYAFYVMRKEVARYKREYEEHNKFKLYKSLLFYKEDNAQLYNIITKITDNIITIELEYLIMRLFKNNNVDFYMLDYNSINNRVPFYRVENNQNVAYVFSDGMDAQTYKEYINVQSIDKFKMILLGEKIGNVIDTIWRWEEKKENNRIEHITIKEVFDLIDVEEYKVFKKYVDIFNKDLRHLIGYNTTSIASDQVIKDFKDIVITSLKSFDYKGMISGLSMDQVDLLDYNFINSGLIYSLVSNNQFADSFISAEWYYTTQIITTNIENTAVVAGYFKSIEQLLYEIIRLFDNTGKTIKKKNSRNEYIVLSAENEDRIDFSMGSMTSCIKYYKNRDMWIVDDDVVNYITDSLKEYREKYRNDHFHKDNLYDINEIEEIRNHTLLLYYMILGGIKISETSKQLLTSKEKEEENDNLLSFEMISEWLDGILSGDNLIDINNKVFIQINRKSSRSELLFTTVKYIRDDGLLEAKAYEINPFFSNPCLFSAEYKAEELEATVINLVRKYIKEGKCREKLSSFKKLYVGLDIEPKELDFER